MKLLKAIGRGVALNIVFLVLLISAGHLVSWLMG